MKNDLEKNGYITVISVVIIGSIATAVAISLLAGGTDAMKNSQTAIHLAQARSLADACAEEALENIRESLYTGTFSLSLPTGICEATVTSSGPADFNIDSLGSSSDAIRKIQVVVDQTDPKVNIWSWQEVADF